MVHDGNKKSAHLERLEQPPMCATCWDVRRVLRVGRTRYELAKVESAEHMMRDYYDVSFQSNVASLHCDSGLVQDVALNLFECSLTMRERACTGCCVDFVRR